MVCLLYAACHPLRSPGKCVFASRADPTKPQSLGPCHPVLRGWFSSPAPPLLLRALVSCLRYRRLPSLSVSPGQAGTGVARQVPWALRLRAVGAGVRVSSQGRPGTPCSQGQVLLCGPSWATGSGVHGCLAQGSLQGQPLPGAAVPADRPRGRGSSLHEPRRQT